MNNTVAEKISSELTKLLMIPISFQDASITILDVHLVNYDILDWFVPKHSHPWYEFLFIIDGSFGTSLQDNKITLNKNDSLLLSPGIVHSHYPHEDNLSLQICIRFKLERLYQNGVLYDQINELFSKKQHISNDMKLECLLENISHESNFANLLGVWNWIIDICKEKIDFSNKPSSFSQILVYQTDLYIEKYFAENISPKLIADILNVSYRTLARRYKEETGITINKKIITVRLDIAKDLLINTDDKIKTIASRVGYSDVYYFSQLFKSEISQSPLAYRKKFRHLDA
ncbi:MAG: helix-turn-helix transcriptional regulator [Clostridia bacterium]|nr:helix-turn-helix transcriptional regulator [Clostridia bacterium]